MKRPAPWGALVFALAIAAPVAAGLFKVWVYQDAVQLGYRLSEGEAKRRELRNEVQQLELERAAERAPARLAELARRLGLVTPEPRQLLSAKIANASGGSHGRP